VCWEGPIPKHTFMSHPNPLSLEDEDGSLRPSTSSSFREVAVIGSAFSWPGLALMPDSPSHEFIRASTAQPGGRRAASVSHLRARPCVSNATRQALAGARSVTGWHQQLQLQGRKCKATVPTRARAT
jgi:hypothetical protein